MKMNIKESMLVRKCLNNYVLENNLEYDKSPLIMGIIDKLKEFERHNYYFSKDSINKARQELRKELLRYDMQTICNKKILELDKLERIESINNNKKGSK